MRFGALLALFGGLFVGCSTPQVTVAVLTPPLYDISDVRTVGVLAAVGYGERHPAQARYIANRVATALAQTHIYRRVKLGQLTETADTPLSTDFVKNLCNRLRVTHIILIRVGYLDIRTRLDVGPSPSFGSYRWYLSGTMRTSVALYSSGGKPVQSPRTVEVSCVSTSPVIQDERTVIGDLCEQTILQIWRFFCPSCKRVRRSLFEDPDPAIARAIDAIICDTPLSAVNYLRFATKKHPKSVPAHYNLAACLEFLGTTYLDEEKMQEALAAYREALIHYQTAARLSPTTHFSQEIAQVSSTVQTLSFIVSRSKPIPQRSLPKKKTAPPKKTSPTKPPTPAAKKTTTTGKTAPKKKSAPQKTAPSRKEKKQK